MKTILILLTVLNHSLCASNGDLLNTLEEVKKKHDLPGIAAAFYKNGKLEEMAASGVRKMGFPDLIQTSDKFHLGSNTKAMTATLAGIFVEKNLIHWKSTLKELLPEIELHSDYREVTFDMLFAHRAGLPEKLPDHKQLWKALRDPNISPAQGRTLVARTLLPKAPVAKPGSEFIYSNAGYMVAAHILEKISGQSYEDLMSEHLFDPLSMDSCGFGPISDPAASSPNQPWAHRRENGQSISYHWDNPPAYGPAGAAHCSMRDWAKFLQAHLNGFNGKAGIVEAETFKKLHTAYPAKESDYTYGGWGIAESDWANGTALVHWGSNTMNTSVVWLAPKKRSILLAVANIYEMQGLGAVVDSIIIRNFLAIETMEK